MSKTYKEIIDLLESSNEKLYVYVNPALGWIPVDKADYIKQLKLFSYVEQDNFPCWIEVENDGEMFIHPNVHNGK